MAEIGKTDTAVQSLRRQLERMGQELAAVSAEIWRDIDHNDPAGLEKGVAYKQRFNQSRGPLEAAVADMIGLLRDYPLGGPAPGDAVAPPKKTVSLAAAPASDMASIPAEPSSQAAATVVGAVRKPPAPAVAGDLGQKVPFGFVLGGQTYTSASAWPLFYEALLGELYARAPERLSRLAEDGSRLQRAGKPLFAKLAERLDDPLPVADGLFAEADLSPGDLIEAIKGLLGEIGFPLDSFKILLKEKNRGTVETLSIAA
jgi:hypothetical protein